jgi:hypothetical protein
MYACAHKRTHNYEYTPMYVRTHGYTPKYAYFSLKQGRSDCYKGYTYIHGVPALLIASSDAPGVH